jgi:hypothetical protein
LYGSRLQGSRSINKIVVFAPWSPRIRALNPKARGMASQSRSFAGGSADNSKSSTAGDGDTEQKSDQ